MKLSLSNLLIICAQKTISMKIFVSRVINCSSHKKCFVGGCINSPFVSKALARSLIPRSFGFLSQTTREYSETCIKRTSESSINCTPPEAPNFSSHFLQLNNAPFSRHLCYADADTKTHSTNPAISGRFKSLLLLNVQLRHL